MITGSFIGSIKETEEVMEFCKEKGLSSTIEMIKLDYINTALERLEKNDVRYSYLCIQCYMKELNMTEEEARMHLKLLINNLWHKLNGVLESPKPLHH